MYKKYLKWIDPPNGHKWGFPKVIPNNVIKDDDLKQWLLENGYLEEDLDFAMRYCRYWQEEVKE